METLIQITDQTLHEDLFLSEREVLQNIQSASLDRIRPDFIYCFGYRLKNGITWSPFGNGKSRQEAAYDLLIVCQNTGNREHEFIDYISAKLHPVQLNVLKHSTASVCAALQTGSYFFKRVVKNGILLFGNCSDDLFAKQSQPMPSAIRGCTFEEHRLKALNFFACSQEMFLKEDYGLSMFMLHQVKERILSGLILAIMGYHTHFHSLNRLVGLCDNFTDAVSSLLVGTSTESHRLFSKLTKAYVNARYETDFAICKSDVSSVQQKIKQLIALATPIATKGNKQ